MKNVMVAILIIALFAKNVQLYLSGEISILLAFSTKRLQSSEAISSFIPSPVMRDKTEGLYSHVGEGKRRVSDLHILDKQSGEYRPVDPARKYTVASFDYILLRLGGSGILRYAKPSDKYWGQCVDNAINYIQNTLKGHIGTQYAEPDGRIIFK